MSIKPKKGGRVFRGGLLETLKSTKHRNFSEELTFLTLDTHTSLTFVTKAMVKDFRILENISL